MKIHYLGIVFVLMGFCASLSAGEKILSPDRRIAVEVEFQEGEISYSCHYDGVEVVAPSPLGLIFSEGLKELEFLDVERTRVDSQWKPHWGEYAVIPEKYEQMVLRFREKNGNSGRVLGVEFRVYNEGFAFRYLLEKRENFILIQGEKTAFRLPSSVVVFPIAWTEDTFPEKPVPWADFQKTSPPLTGKFADGKVFCILEAYVQDYPRFQLNKNADGALQVSVRETMLPEGEGRFTTPWRGMMLAENEARLVENGYFIANLNPPCTSDCSWVVPGKTISNAMNCQIRMNDLIGLVDFAAENQIRYVQIDWGWYGTEWVYTDAECEEWAKNNPDKAADPTWRANTKPNPYQVAKGLVPYFPRFKASTYVDMDLEKLIAYGKSKGVGICLYINDRMLKKYDLDELFAEYARWGLAGLKPGFVAYGSTKDTNDIRRLVEVASKYRLWLCVHDAYLPDGMSRTYPGLMNVEGGGGQEGWHPEYHDVTLPFTRGLVGPFDYTPAIYVKNRSHAHQLSLLLTLYAPSHVIRGAWSIRNNETGNAFGTEQEFLRRVESTWEDTCVLDAKIGKYIVTARKNKDGIWFLGGTNGSEAYISEVKLDFLEPNRDYTLKLWTEASEAQGEWRGTLLSLRKVRASDTLHLPMAPAGGVVGILE
ncbi:MAG: glycoside hydrolase family 97 N-terminal domain-containing protein [Planctomycetia bacterium]|nr:glycoside hydrolase family 97 N-terminal domain-containing protein [Planctomycetia bacterium]